MPRQTPHPVVVDAEISADHITPRNLSNCIAEGVYDAFRQYEALTGIKLPLLKCYTDAIGNVHIMLKERETPHGSG